MSNHTTVIRHTQTWLEQVVLGLNLCPFAHRPYHDGAIRYAVHTSDDTNELHQLLFDEILALSHENPKSVETTLIIYPESFADFMAYLDFLAYANDTLTESAYDGIMQLASFHPQYLFCGEPADDQSHYTNRSPYPIIQIIREDSISGAIEDGIDTASIPDDNIRKMRQLSRAQIKALFSYSIK